MSPTSGLLKSGTGHNNINEINALIGDFIPKDSEVVTEIKLVFPVLHGKDRKCYHPPMGTKDTIAVAAFVLAVVTFAWNTYTFHRSTNLTLFKERFAVYTALHELFKEVDKHEEEDLTQDDIRRFKHTTDHAEFLFGPEIRVHLNAVYNEAFEIVNSTAVFRHNEQQSHMIMPEAINKVNNPLRDKITMSRRRVRDLERATNPLFANYLDMFNRPWYGRLEYAMQHSLDIGENILNSRYR